MDGWPPVRAPPGIEPETFWRMGGAQAAGPPGQGGQFTPCGGGFCGFWRTPNHVCDTPWPREPFGHRTRCLGGTLWPSLPQPPVPGSESLKCSRPRGTFRTVNHLPTPDARLGPGPAPPASSFCRRTLAPLAPQPLPGGVPPSAPKVKSSSLRAAASVGPPQGASSARPALLCPLGPSPGGARHIRAGVCVCVRPCVAGVPREPVAPHGGGHVCTAHQSEGRHTPGAQQALTEQVRQGCRRPWARFSGSQSAPRPLLPAASSESSLICPPAHPSHRGRLSIKHPARAAPSPRASPGLAEPGQAGPLFPVVRMSSRQSWGRPVHPSPQVAAFSQM